MNVSTRTMLCLISTVVIGLLAAGCGQQAKSSKELNEFAAKIDLGTTIGSLVEVFSLDTIAVEGYSIVGGLNGTGSLECPPELRAYLEQYILKQSSRDKIDIGKLISSMDTAVVRVDGIMPAAVSKNQHFDVRVAALDDTQTTSLEGGWLYGAELKATGEFGIATKALAHAEGPVFIDTLSSDKPDKKSGYVLAGGTVGDEYKINLTLRRPDYKIANLIRNRINERFGQNTAKAVSPSLIDLKVPAQYKQQKQGFISLIKATYLTQTPETATERIRTFVRKLAVSQDKQDKYESEIALEAIGKDCLGQLAALLNSSDGQVRLHAARCMLNLGSDAGLDSLRDTAMDKGSPYRIEALEAITMAANRNDAVAISRKLLRDSNFDIRLRAYENLRKLDDIAIVQKFVGQNFYLEKITQTPHKGIFVSRSSQPRIVLFGAPIYCRDNIFIQSEDASITINAPPGQNYVSLIRKHPKRPNVIVRLKSSFELGDIIQTLGEEPLEKAGQEPRGLGVTYDELIALLKQMHDKGAIDAEFRAGSLPKIGPIVKR